MVPKWTYSELLMQSNVHFRVLLQKVNPSLYRYLDIAHGELNYGWSVDMPQPEGSYWQKNSHLKTQADSGRRVD
jgi:hypothetical protein